MLKHERNGNGAQTHNILSLFQITNPLVEAAIKNAGFLNEKIGSGVAFLQGVVDNNKILIDDFRRKTIKPGRFTERKVHLEVSLIKGLLEESIKHHDKHRNQVGNTSVITNTCAFFESVNDFMKHPNMMSYIYLVKSSNRLLGSLEGLGDSDGWKGLGVGFLYGDDEKELLILAERLAEESVKNRDLFCFDKFLELSKKQN